MVIFVRSISVHTIKSNKTAFQAWRILCFHSRDQHLCKFIGIKESVYIRKEFNSHRISLEHQNGRRFIALGRKYGRHDVMWKYTINVKGEMFIWEWDKENLRVPFSDKDLSEIRNATSWVKTFQIAKSKHRQDVHDSRYTKTIHCF